MVTVFYKGASKVVREMSANELAALDLSNVVWIDLTSPTAEEKAVAESIVNIKFFTRQQAQEIETTSKYSETENVILVNIDYYIDRGKDYDSVPISFIITKNGLLVTYHQVQVSAWSNIDSRMKFRPEDNQNGFGVFMTTFEAVIDYEADMEELISREISRLSKNITASSNIDKAILHRINELQEKSTALREDVYDLERVLNNTVRSKLLTPGGDVRITLMIKDAESLINHGDISFSRLDYLQDTAMGLINIQQNEIVKILSVAAVIFMPPTLIASIYGMNFKVMPELDWVWNLQNGWVVPAGYIFAIFLMVVVTYLTYWFFRFKKWL